MIETEIPSIIKKEIINRWFGSNDSANRIAEDLKLPMSTVLSVIENSRRKKAQAPLITDDKIPFQKMEQAE